VADVKTVCSLAPPSLSVILLTRGSLYRRDASEEFSPWMKVPLYDDDLFYYTIVMHTDMQELMWAAECIDSVLSAVIR
jgi:hypothetical protein